MDPPGQLVAMGQAIWSVPGRIRAVHCWTIGSAGGRQSTISQLRCVSSLVHPLSDGSLLRARCTARMDTSSNQQLASRQRRLGPGYGCHPNELYWQLLCAVDFAW